jgi:hypothetical protein
MTEDRAFPANRSIHGAGVDRPEVFQLNSVTLSETRVLLRHRSGLWEMMSIDFFNGANSDFPNVALQFQFALAEQSITCL